MKRIVVVLMLAMSCADEPKDLGGVCKAAFAVWGFDVVECKDCFVLEDFDTVLVIIGDSTVDPYIGYTNGGVIRLKYFDFNLLSHEVGHNLLVPHNDRPGSLMYPDTPNSLDISAEEYTRAHLINSGREIKCEIMTDTL